MTPEALVVGAGIAGSALAIALQRRGWSVRMLERDGASPDVRLGETLPPAALPVLGSLGVAPSSYGVACHGNQSAWGQGELGERDFITSPYGSGRFVDRVELGRRLRSVAEAEGATVTAIQRLRSLNRIAGRWYVDCQTSGRSLHLSADAVVDASGRARALLRVLGVGVRTEAHLVALYRRFALPRADADPLPCVTLLESSASGWWYAAPQPEHAELLVMLVTDRAALRETRVHRSERYSSALERTHHVSRWVTRCARSGSLSPRGVDAQVGGATRVSDASGWLSVGDAAMTLDPLSSRGISSALASSLHAAHALTAWRQGDTTALARYGSQLRAVYAAHLEQRSVHYRSERRFPESGFWQRQGRLAIPEQGSAILR